MTRNLRFTAAGCVGILIFTFTGVSAAAGTGSVPKTVVEAQAAKVLAQETELKPPTVTCPGDLKGQVGASIQCTLTPAGSKLVYPVKVTVNSVKNGTAHFYVQVGQAFGVANKAKFCHDNAVLDRSTRALTNAGQAVDTFCGQNADGSPAGSPPTTAG